MNELTTIQAVLYGISGILLYVMGFVAGQFWIEYKIQISKQKKISRSKKQQHVGLGFDPNNPMNRNFDTYRWQTQDEMVKDKDGNVWYIRRPL